MKNKSIVKSIRNKIADPTEDLQRFLDRIPSMLGYWNSDLTNKISNQAYASYFGKLPSEIKGTNIKDLLGPKIYKSNLPFVRGALSGIPQTFERKLLCEDGTTKETVANYVPDFIGGKVIGFFVIVTDITPIKKLESLNRDIEAKLVASSKMSSLGEMASGIAHEINNPLSILYASACQTSSLIQKKNPDFQKIKVLLNDIEATALRIEKIVDGLRLFSSDTSKQPFERCNALSIVQDTLELCKARIDSYKINLSLKVTDSSLFINCRPIEISQVLINLLNNSIDAVAESNVKSISIKLKSKGKDVLFEVSNSGSKISKQLADKIFQPFFTTKEVGKGTGLGLSISKGIAENHNGSLTLDLKSKNTKFTLCVPKEA